MKLTLRNEIGVKCNVRILLNHLKFKFLSMISVFDLQINVKCS